MDRYNLSAKDKLRPTQRIPRLLNFNKKNPILPYFPQYSVAVQSAFMFDDSATKSLIDCKTDGMPCHPDTINEMSSLENAICHILLHFACRSPFPKALVLFVWKKENS